MKIYTCAQCQPHTSQIMILLITMLQLLLLAVLHVYYNYDYNNENDYYYSYFYWTRKGSQIGTMVVGVVVSLLKNA